MLKGIKWALSEIPSGKIIANRIYTGDKEIILKKTRKDLDDFTVKHKKDSIIITGDTDRSFIYGLLEIADQAGSKKTKDMERKLPFRTRNYKHEIRFEKIDGREGWGDRKSIREYTPRFWESLMQELTKRHFNGLVFYPGYSPFPYLLDFKKYPEAAVIPKSEVLKNRKAFNTACRIAKEYGIRTYVQEYINHFTQGLARHHKLPIYAEGGKPGLNTRLASLKTPETYGYARSCYKELFKLCPDLGGIYLNFESAKNSYDFIEKTMISVLNTLKDKPVLVYRLWNANIPELIKRLFRIYKGKSILAHKINETSDCYYYPVADSHIREWKEQMPNTEFMFLVGPCHNCSSNIARRLWSDPEFIYRILEDAKLKGADSISFNTVFELMGEHLKDNKVLIKSDRDMAWLNYFHLDTYVRFIKGEKFSHKRWISHYKNHFKISEKRASLLYRAITDASKIIPTIYRQYAKTNDSFNMSTGKFFYTQEPFFIFPSTFYNNFARKEVNCRITWLHKMRDEKVLPDTQQYIIDYADPSKRNTRENPLVLANRLEKYAKSCRDACKKLKSSDPSDKRFKMLEFFIDADYRVGMRIAKEMKSSIHFCKCYFAKSKAVFISEFKKGLALFKQCEPLLCGNPENERFVRTVVPAGQMFEIEHHIKDLENILKKVETGDYPFKAFEAFVRSRKQHNEIRRYCRPSYMHTPSTMAHAKRDIKKSMTAIGECIRILEGIPKYECHLNNANAWLEYLEYEQKRIDGESVVCTQADDVLEVDEQFLGTDHCFRHGEYFYTDFNDFFAPFDHTKTDKVTFHTVRGKNGLTISLNRYDCDVRQLEKDWDAIQGSNREMWHLKIYIDPGTDRKKGLLFTVAPRGRYVLKRNIEYRHKQYFLNSIAEVEKGVKTKYRRQAHSFTLDVTVPYKLLGRTPKKGDKWGLNLFVNNNIALDKNHIICPKMVWNANFESFMHQAGNPFRAGELIFE